MDDFNPSTPPPVEFAFVANANRIPFPPELSRVRARTPYHISFGEYNGQPNFLLLSDKGVTSGNLPAPLDRPCRADGMKSKILDFSLGQEGRYYLLWREGNEARMVNSPGLWNYVNEYFEGGSVIRCQFGGAGTVWGIRSCTRDGGTGDFNTSKSWDGAGYTEKGYTEGRDYKFAQSPSNAQSFTWEKEANSRKPDAQWRKNEPVVEEKPFGWAPNEMMQKMRDVTSSSQNHGQVDFTAVGNRGCWVMGAMGHLCFWDKLEGNLLEDLLNVYRGEGGLKNVVLAPTTDTIYFIEGRYGTIRYSVPDEWDVTIKSYLASVLNGPQIQRFSSLSQRSPTESQPQSPLHQRHGSTPVYSQAVPGGSQSGIRAVESQPNSSAMPPTRQRRAPSSSQSVPPSSFQSGRSAAAELYASAFAGRSQSQPQPPQVQPPSAQRKTNSQLSLRDDDGQSVLYPSFAPPAPGPPTRTPSLSSTASSSMSSSSSLYGSRYPGQAQTQPRPPSIQLPNSIVYPGGAGSSHPGSGGGNLVTSSFSPPAPNYNPPAPASFQKPLPPPPPPPPPGSIPPSSGLYNSTSPPAQPQSQPQSRLPSSIVYSGKAPPGRGVSQSSWVGSIGSVDQTTVPLVLPSPASATSTGSTWQSVSPAPSWSSGPPSGFPGSSPLPPFTPSADPSQGYSNYTTTLPQQPSAQTPLESAPPSSAVVTGGSAPNHPPVSGAGDGWRNTPFGHWHYGGCMCETQGQQASGGGSRPVMNTVIEHLPGLVGAAIKVATFVSGNSDSTSTSDVTGTSDWTGSSS